MRGGLNRCKRFGLGSTKAPSSHLLTIYHANRTLRIPFPLLAPLFGLPHEHTSMMFSHLFRLVSGLVWLTTKAHSKPALCTTRDIWERDGVDSCVIDLRGHPDTLALGFLRVCSVFGPFHLNARSFTTSLTNPRSCGRMVREGDFCGVEGC